VEVDGLRRAARSEVAAWRPELLRVTVPPVGRRQRMRLLPVGDDVVVDVRPLFDSLSPNHIQHVAWFKAHGVGPGDIAELVKNPNGVHYHDRDLKDHEEDRVQRFFYVKGTAGEEDNVRCMAIIELSRARTKQSPPEIVLITAYDRQRPRGPRGSR
jgi:hypothetical protein